MVHIACPCWWKPRYNYGYFKWFFLMKRVYAGYISSDSFDETRIYSLYFKWFFLMKRVYASVFQVILFDETDAYTKVHMICLLGESFPIAAYANGKTLCSCFGFVSDFFLFLFFLFFFPCLCLCLFLCVASLWEVLLVVCFFLIN